MSDSRSHGVRHIIWRMQGKEGRKGVEESLETMIRKRQGSRLSSPRRNTREKQV